MTAGTGQGRYQNPHTIADNLASYSENAGGYILSKGDYGVRIGTSSRDTKPVCKIRLEQTALTEQVLVELPLTETLEEKEGLTDRKDETIWKDVPVLLAVQIPETLDSRSAYSDEKVVTYATDTSYKPVMPYRNSTVCGKEEWKLNDVASGRVSMEEFAAQRSLHNWRIFAVVQAGVCRMRTIL